MKSATSWATWCGLWSAQAEVPKWLPKLQEDIAASQPYACMFRQKSKSRGIDETKTTHNVYMYIYTGIHICIYIYTHISIYIYM